MTRNCARCAELLRYMGWGLKPKSSDFKNIAGHLLERICKNPEQVLSGTSLAPQRSGTLLNATADPLFD